MKMIYGASLIGLILGLNSLFIHLPAIGMIAGIIYIAIVSWLYGNRSKATDWYERLILGFVSLLSVIIIIGTAAFYLNIFNRIFLTILLALLPWGGKISPVNDKTASSRRQPLSWQTVGAILTCLVLLGLSLATLYHGQTLEAIRTPWQAVPSFIFPLYGLAAVAFIYFNHRLHPGWLTGLYFVSLSVLPIIYNLGYGFDPFIHQATEKILFSSGTISPQPWYYLGQYTLVVWLAQILALAVNLVDKWLVPALASLILPGLTIWLVRRFTNQPPLIYLTALGPLLFSLNQFTYTTPQGLANLMAAAMFFLLAGQSLGARPHPALTWVIALAALSVHPLTGLPILGINLIYYLATGSILSQITARQKKLLLYLSAGATILAVPTAFALLSWLKPSSASIAWPADWWQNLSRVGNGILNTLPQWPRWIELVDGVYLIGLSVNLIIIALAIWGWHKARKIHPIVNFFVLAFGLLAASYLLLTFSADFPYLPPNEQNFYSIRLWQLALLSLWPLALYGAYKLIEHIKQTQAAPGLIIIGGALILTASFYLTYPRQDVYHRDTGYNTTPYDIAAVEFIEQMAQDAPYVVLANQAVSAAAVNRYGFAHYYNGQFYYPLPTGTNPLYQIYLTAAERSLPTRQVIKPATATSGLSQVFLVLNKYWADFDKLTAVAEQEANDSWQIGAGQIKIYRYYFSD